MRAGGCGAGIAAAVPLARGGAAVTVYEAARTLGGRARRVTLDDIHLDNGQHVLLGAYRETLGMLRAVGVDPGAALLRSPLVLEIAGHFRLRVPKLPAPLHLLAGLLRARGLAAAERLRAARFVLAISARGYRLAEDVPAPLLLAAPPPLGAPPARAAGPARPAPRVRPRESASRFGSDLRRGNPRLRSAPRSAAARRERGAARALQRARAPRI